MKLFVTSLPASYTGNQLERLFSPYGVVLFTGLIIDKETKKSKCFGFVQIQTESEGNLAIRRLNGQSFEGKKIIVKKALSQEKKSPTKR